MTAHILLDPDSDHGLLCSHCHGIDSVPYPCEVSRYIDVCRAFELRHRACPKPEKPSPQLALPGTELQREIEAQEIAADGGNGSVCSTNERERCDLCRQWVRDISIHRCGEVDASTDSLAPEIDPPGPYARFEELYPVATNHQALAIALGEVLTFEQCQRVDIGQWHSLWGTFNAVANWARIEKAHLDAGKREPIAGLTIPRREPMPEKLAELLGVKPKQKKGARPLTSPKRRRNGTESRSISED